MSFAFRTRRRWAIGRPVASFLTVGAIGLTVISPALTFTLRGTFPILVAGFPAVETFSAFVLSLHLSGEAFGPRRTVVLASAITVRGGLGLLSSTTCVIGPRIAFRLLTFVSKRTKHGF
jgi:hypothetical protein